MKKQRHYFVSKVCLVKAMVFPVVMYGCESWTIKKAEHWRIDAFELWVWRRLLRIPGAARRSSQSILKEISPGCSLEGLMLKLKLQYFGHLMQRADSFERPWCWERLRAGGEWDDRGWDCWMSSPTQWTWVWVDSGSWWWTGRPGMLRFMGSQRVRHDWVNELNWTMCVHGWIMFFAEIHCCCCCYLVTQLCLTLRPHGLSPTRLLCLSNSPGENTVVGCHALLQGIFPIQGLNPGLLLCRQILYHWATREAHINTLQILLLFSQLTVIWVLSTFSYYR